MSRKKWLLFAGAMLALVVWQRPAFAEHDHGQGNGHGHAYGHDKHDRDADDRDDHDRGEHGRGHYRDHDRELRGWYREHYDRLPPGLAKRDELPPGLQRQLVVRGTLPPGLQRKMHPCPVEIEQYLPPPPPGYMHTVIGGNIVLVNRRTFFVLDVFHF
jgi:Ni/Co efflux regulator RcnB